MPVNKFLGKRCKYAETCPLYQGTGLPENMTRTIWRNVFCYRGEKGWSNCEKYRLYEEEKSFK
jgi:hypothetical protein